MIQLEKWILTLKNCQGDVSVFILPLVAWGLDSLADSYQTASTVQFGHTATLPLQPLTRGRSLLHWQWMLTLEEKRSTAHVADDLEQTAATFVLEEFGWVSPVLPFETLEKFVRNSVQNS